MDRYSRERLEELFRNGGPIPQHFVAAAFDSDDVGAQDLARVIVLERFHRVKPKMELTWSGECLMRYYLQRIKAGTLETDESIGTYQGAYGLAALLRNAWKNRSETAELVAEIVERVTRMFH